MHPRPDVRVPAEGMQAWSAAERKKAELLLAFLESRGEVHPREVEEHFAHGRVRNYWGGSSHATTQMLDALHYRGLVRVVRRENGIRIYRTHRHQATRLGEERRRARIDALVDVAVNIYAPLPAPKRKLGYYALPLPWRDSVIGWANLAVKNGALLADFGYTQAPNDRAFEHELEAELSRMQFFLPNVKC